MTEEEKVELSTRQLLVSTVCERLMHTNKAKEAGEVFTVAQLAALIVDDLMASAGMAAIIERTTQNGLDSGYRQGIRAAQAKEEPCPEPEASSPLISVTA